LANSIAAAPKKSDTPLKFKAIFDALADGIAVAVDVRQLPSPGKSSDLNQNDERQVSASRKTTNLGLTVLEHMKAVLGMSAPRCSDFSGLVDLPDSWVPPHSSPRHLATLAA